MPRYNQDDTQDPEEVIRRRVTQQVEAQDPAPTPTAAETPPAPAPFQPQDVPPSNESYTPPEEPRAPAAYPDPTPQPTADTPPPYITPPDPAVQGGVDRAGGLGGNNLTVTPDRASAGSDIRSQILALYAKYGYQPAGRGSGFADVDYWAEHPSEVLNGRLEADIAGRGSDQPTGTPWGPGAWQNSGAGARTTTTPTTAAPPRTTTAGTTTIAPGTTATFTGGNNGGLPTTAQMQAAGLEVPQGLWSPDFIAQLRQMILQRLNASSQPVNENDPQISAPLTAARDEATRQSETERTKLAERLYAQGGLGTDALTRQIQQSGERNSQALGGLRATLITRELQSRREDLQDALRLAIQAGDAETARQVQLQIAALDATLRRESVGADLAKYSGYLNALSGQQLTA